MRSKTACVGCACLLLGVGAIQARAQAPDEDDYVSREEHDALRRDFEAMKAELEAMKQRPAPQAQEAADEPSWLELEQSRLRIDALEQMMEEVKPGLSNFHLTGYGFTRFVNREGADSTFTAQFVPLFLWEINDRLLFEAEVEIELESEDGASETAVELEYAHASYILNDYVTIGAGKFLTPFGLFPERLHPAWINKLPDGPLIFGHDGIAPFSSLGFYVRGGFPVGSTKLNYAVYLSNGPFLITDVDEEAGNLEFDNFEDVNNNKAVGGRVGFLPVPEVEVGWSFLFGKVNPSGSDVGSAEAFIWGFDATYVQEVDFLAGLFDVRFEYVRSEVDDVIYDPTGALGFGPLTFDNTRDGLYTQVAYRPTKSDIKFLRDFEVVGRYDYLNLPAGAPEDADHERWTLGLNYWLNPSTVLKFAYQRTMEEGEPDQDAFLAQFAIGF